MAAATKKSFRQTVSQGYQKAKTKTKNYSSKVEQAYKAGYVSGWKDRDKVPTTFGCRQSAMLGYGHGLRDHQTSREAQRRAKSWQ